METPHNNHRYHVEMMLSELRKLAPRDGLTRVFLSLDPVEKKIIDALLEQELAAIDRTLKNEA